MSDNTKSYEKLERVIDRVAADYDGSKEIDNLESAALPNRRAVIEALNHLKPVIYMGFYATRALSIGNLRYAVSDHLYPAFETLADQIRRAMAYQQMCGRDCPEMLGEWAENVVLRLFEKLPDLRQQLNEDVNAAYHGDPAAKGIEEVIFSYPAIQAITTYRIAHELYEQQVPMIPRIMTEHAHGKTGIDIHPGAKIGRRFFIDHGTGVVIGETSVIGDDVKLYQGVTLGALSLPRDDSGDLIRNGRRHPRLEDKVTIYSGATVLGGQTVIGEGSIIGGNVWVVESVPPYSKITFSARTQVSEVRPQARKAS